MAEFDDILFNGTGSKKKTEKITIDELRSVLRYISKGYKVPQIVYDVIKEAAIKEIEQKNKIVITKRDPDIARERIQAQYVKVIEGNAIEICPTIVGGYGADFDGDTMAVFVPLSEEAQNEARNKLMSVTQNSSLNVPNFELSKEMLTGIFTLTMDYKPTPVVKLNSTDDAYKLDIGTTVDVFIKGKRIKTTAGRVVFNSNLPNYIGFVDEAVPKKLLNGIFGKIIAKNKVDYIESVNRMMSLGFRYSTEYPKTISTDLLQMPKSLEKLKEKLGKEKDIVKQSEIIDEMEKEMMDYLKDHVPDLYIQCASGAAKGTSQLRQIMVAKGLIADANGNILPPVTKAIGEGFTPEEYFNAAAGSRKGTIDRVISTARGGYTYRKMIYAVGDVEANIENADCGTKRTFNIKLTPELFKRMNGRYIQNLGTNKIERVNESMVGKIIPLRSPIFCKSRAICRICYGDLIYQIKSKNVGLISAQEVCSLSEKIMKGFHTGGAVILDRIDIIKELSLNIEDVYFPELKKLVHQTENDLITDANSTTLTIEKKYYNHPSKKFVIEKKGNEINLSVGYFTLNMDGFEVFVTMEQPVSVYVYGEIKETEETISLLYSKDQKVFLAEPKAIAPAEVAQRVGDLVSGISPWKNPENLYMKFFNLLKGMGGWDSCHLEVIISNILRNKINPQIPARLKEPYQPVTFPINDLPSIISYPLGIAFQNFEKGLKFGLISERANPSEIEKIMFGVPLIPPKRKK